MYWIYILHNPLTNRRYTGSTGELERRLAEHRVKKPGYALIYKETFETKHEAQAREKFLKTGDGRCWFEKRFLDLSV
jgi:putative endonuclease